jgi:hypothetical protein
MYVQQGKTTLPVARAALLSSLVPKRNNFSKNNTINVSDTSKRNNGDSTARECVRASEVQQG